MASHLLPHRPNKLSDSLSTDARHGRSKAQISLQKILDFIVSSRSSLPHQETPNQSLSSRFDLEVKGVRDQNGASFCHNKKGFRVDLNIVLGPSPQAEDSGPRAAGGHRSAAGGRIGCDGVCAAEKSNSKGAASADVSIVDEKSWEDECDRTGDHVLYGGHLSDAEANENEAESAVVDGQAAMESSEVTNLQIRSSEIDAKGVSGENKGSEDGKVEAEVGNKCFKKERERGSEGCLGLLIEAAKLISGGFRDDEHASAMPSQSPLGRPDDDRKLTCHERGDITRGSKRSQCWMVDLYGDFGDVSPVVRSKRGRNQVLPYRYRDSVVEPLTRLSRQRSTTLSTRRR